MDAKEVRCDNGDILTSWPLTARFKSVKAVSDDRGDTSLTMVMYKVKCDKEVRVDSGDTSLS